MERLFVDTSAWVALVNVGDPEHARVQGVLAEYERRLVTTNYILDETVTHCMRRHGHDVALRIGNALQDDRMAHFIRITSEDERCAWELFGDRPDKQYSFTDCTSFVLMRRLGIDKAAALDDDFRAEGFEVLPG